MDEQLPFSFYPRWEERIDQLIQLRWAFVTGTLVVSFLADSVFPDSLPMPILVMIAVAIMAYNAAFLLYARRLHSDPGQDPERRFVQFANVQIASDMVALTVWLHFTGGIENPFYLFYIAFSLWRDATKTIDLDSRPLRRAFLQGLLINALNPKSVLFAAAVLVVVFPANLHPGEIAIVVANHFLVELGFYALLAGAISSSAMRDRYLRARAPIDRTAAVVLGLLALRLLTGT